MQVCDLIEQLRRVPQDAHVVVSGDVVHGIELRTGYIELGYMNPTFHRNPKGKVQAVVFLANTELSTGEIVSTPR